MTATKKAVPKELLDSLLADYRKPKQIGDRPRFAKTVVCPLCFFYCCRPKKAFPLRLTKVMIQADRSASRSTVSGNFSTSRISSAACAFGLARPCSQFSSVRGLVRR